MNPTDRTNLSTTDAILYPFGNVRYLAKNPPLNIVGGDGVHVTDSTGKTYLDGQASLWNVNVGHRRPEIMAAITAQMDKLSYYSIFGNTTVGPAVDLAHELVRLTAPEGMVRSFYSSGGSEANESGIKLARQYWRHMGQPTRYKIFSLKQAYHGVTLGALSAIGTTAHREPFEPLAPGFYQAETPYLYRNPFTRDHAELGRICVQLLEREILFQGPNTVAAIMAEPVQGAGGVIVPPENFWPALRALCDKYGILLMSDEVITGFGRTGHMTGARLWGVAPDIMNFAKGINSGYVPLGATMMNARVADAFDTDDDAQFSAKAFYHGNTYAGHPLGCVAAMANLKIVEEEDLCGNAGRIGAYMLDRLKDMQSRHPNVGDIRGVGLMIGVELVENPETRAKFPAEADFGARIWQRCVDDGVLIRNLADTFIISPPLVITEAHADRIVDVFEAAIAAET